MVENIVGSTITPRSEQSYMGVTGIVCPTCSKNTLYVVADLENTITLECPNCRYVENKPRNHIVYRPIKVELK